MTPRERRAAFTVIAYAGWTPRDVLAELGALNNSTLAAAHTQAIAAIDFHKLGPSEFQGEALASWLEWQRRQPSVRFSSKSAPIVEAILAVFARLKPPLTVRQVYYQLATVGLVQLSQAGYRVAQRLQKEMRVAGMIPWSHYADSARARKAPNQWDDLSDFVDTVDGIYRKDLWQAQPEHVEFWLEKEALSRFVESALHDWGNPLCVVRGFSSLTFVHECADELKRITKPKFIYYLGDHDPSGLSIESSIKERLTEFGADFTFQRLAISLDDIAAYNLRPLEAKRSDSRHASYVAEHGTSTVELDALPPDVFRARIRSTVEQHIDLEAWQRLQRVEAIERASANDVFTRMRALTKEAA